MGEIQNAVPQEAAEKFSHVEERRLLSFSPEEWDKILYLLKLAESTGEVQVDLSAGYSKCGKPQLLLILIAPDWAGLVNTVAGFIHEGGYNINYLTAMVDSSGKYGIITTHIILNSEEEMKKVEEEIRQRLGLLKAVARGGGSIEKLVHIGTKKLEVYEKVVEAIKKMAQEEELKELLSERGEVERFIISRSEAYLVERKPEDLARQILTNYRFQKLLREKGRGAYVSVENIETTREKLTCISAAGFERDLSLDDVMDWLREYIPDYIRKYDKQFVTSDGIAVIRLEITDGSGQPLKEEELPLLERQLFNKLKRRRQRETFELKAGTELLGRVLIPKLIQEAESSGKAQAYILPGKVTRDSAEFKLIVVSPFKKDEGESIHDKLLDSLSAEAGISVSSAKPPTKMRGFEVSYINLKADLAEFNTEEEIYDVIKQRLQEVLGEFRDFDEGMRRLDRQKMKQVLASLENRGLAPRFVKQFFYAMDDFYRISASVDEITDQIMFASDILRMYLKSGSNRILCDFIERDTYVLVGIIGPQGEVNLERYLRTLGKFNPVLTVLDIFGASLIVFYFKKKDNWEELKKALDALEIRREKIKK